MSTWTFDLAQRVLERVQRRGKTYATFECGFGPSGLPHIGTVAEMLRTRMVIRAFNEITTNISPSEHPEDYYRTQWILFADDLDALRKVPETIPEDKKSMMQSYLGVSVSAIPDPWGTHSSYAEHNISELVRLLELCGVQRNEYELRRSSHQYGSGYFNPTLRKLAQLPEEISEIITHDYSAERIATYWPFLPIISGQVVQDLYEPQMETMPASMSSVPQFTWYDRERDSNPLDTRQLTVTSLFDGNIKCQWKLDWPMRWIANDVDFEMHGKDLIGSASVGKRICKLFQHEEPVIFMYELFLDEEGKKISKSKGNGLEADEWLNYGTVESLEYFLFQNPVKGRALHWKAIPQYMDMYAKELTTFLASQVNDVPRESALWHIHGAHLPDPAPLTYAMLLNLVGITDTEDPEVLWAYVNAYRPDLDDSSHASLSKMIPGAIRFYQRFVLPVKVRRNPTDAERGVLADIIASLQMDPEDLRSEIYDIGKRHYGDNRLREYFAMLYQVLLGQDSGPPFNQFVQVIGNTQAIELIQTALHRVELHLDEHL